MITTITLDGMPITQLDTNPIRTPQTQVMGNFDKGITPVQAPTELGETLRELNKDNIDPQTRMSGIDMRSRLHYAEVGSVLALDALVALGVLPTKCLAFSRQKKRLSVSVGGKGRDDFIAVVSGKREMDKAKAGMGMMGGMGDKVGSFMGFK